MRLPGQRYIDPRNRLANSLLEGATSTAPVQHPIQAYGRLAQALMATYLNNQATEDRAAANEAFVKGASAQPWIDPDTGKVAPGQTNVGGSAGALTALRGLEDNPVAAEMAQRFTIDDIQRQEAARLRSNERLLDEEHARAMARFNADLQLRNALGVQAAKPQKPTIVSPGASVLGSDNKPVFTAPSVPLAGRDIPYPPDVQAQRLAARRAGRSTVNVGPSGVDYGKPEAGLAWARNADGSVKLDNRGAPIAVPYQGGSAFNEELAAADAAKAKEAGQRRQADIVITDIDRVMELVRTATLPTTGSAGEFISNIGGTAAGDVRRLLDTIKANVGFDRLQAMRDASPTGGALGQISENENRLLQSVLGSLEQSLSQEEFMFNLDRLRVLYEDIIHTGTYIPSSGAASDIDIDGLSDSGITVRRLR